MPDPRPELPDVPEVSAEAIRAAHGAPDAHDLADFAEPGDALGRFADRLGELLGQIAVMGLAHPDPDLAPAAVELIEPASALGLGAAAEGLAELARALGAIRAAAPPGRSAPAALTRAAWDATQRLVAWRRLFRRALALQRVEGLLARDALIARGARPPPSRPATASARIRPVGLALRDDRLTLLGIDVDRGGPAQIRDRLSDHDPDDPLGGAVISRLFQARISLRAVLDGVIVFEDHPARRARGVPLFEPDFRARPRLLGAAGPLSVMPDPVDDPAALERLRRPVRADVRVERGLDAPTLRLGDGEVEVERTPIFELNLIKRLIEASGAPLALILGPAPGAPRVLSALDADRRLYVSHDPRVFTVPPAALYHRLGAAADRMGRPIAARFVRTVAGLFGGADDRALGALAEQWRGPAPGIGRLYRGVLAGRLLSIVGDPARDAAVEAAVDDALLVGALPAGQVRPAALTALVGEPTAGRLPGRAVFRALWLLFTGDPGGVRARRGALLTLFAARYAEMSSAPEPHDVAARALLLAELSREAAEGDADAGLESLSPEEVLAPAREYLEAHLAGLRPAPGRPAGPLPDFDGLWALAEAHRLLHPDAEPRGLPALGLHRPTLAAAAAGALLDLDRRPLRAADGLLCAAAAGLEGWLIG